MPARATLFGADYAPLPAPDPGDLAGGVAEIGWNKAGSGGGAAAEPRRWRHDRRRYDRRRLHRHG